MSIKALTLYSFFTLLGLSSFHSQPEPRFFVIGDSISMQYGPYLMNAISAFGSYDRIREPDQDLSKGQGINGQDSRNVLKILNEFDFGKTDYLLLNCGLHDIKTNPETKEQQVPIKEYERNLKKIVKLVNSKKTTLIWITTTPSIDSIHNTKSTNMHRYAEVNEAYHQVAMKVMKRNKIRTIALREFSQDFPPSAFTDHVHYKTSYRQEQAAFIAGNLARILVEK